MRERLQGIAAAILLIVALLADGLMDSLGPLGFILTAGPAIATAGVLVWLSDRPQKRSRPRGKHPQERQASRKG